MHPDNNHSRATYPQRGIMPETTNDAIAVLPMWVVNSGVSANTVVFFAKLQTIPDLDQPISHQQLADKLNMGVPGVRKHLRDLRMIGAVKTIRYRRDMDGGRGPNGYHINMDEPDVFWMPTEAATTMQGPGA